MLNLRLSISRMTGGWSLKMRLTCRKEGSTFGLRTSKSSMTARSIPYRNGVVNGINTRHGRALAKAPGVCRSSSTGPAGGGEFKPIKMGIASIGAFAKTTSDIAATCRALVACFVRQTHVPAVHAECRLGRTERCRLNYTYRNLDKRGTR